MLRQIYNFGLISFKLNLLDDKTTIKVLLVFGNHLFNKIYYILYTQLPLEQAKNLEVSEKLHIFLASF